MNCTCSPQEKAIGHHPRCPLNEALKPEPIVPRKPFEEMTRDEMIVAHTALRHQTAEYVTELHKLAKAAAKVEEYWNESDCVDLDVEFAMGDLRGLLGEKPHLS